MFAPIASLRPVRQLLPETMDVPDVAALVAAESRPRPPGRPWVLLNMVASLDGAIALEGRSGGLSGPGDKDLFFALRAIADLILVGAGTVRAEGYGPPKVRAEWRAARLARGQSPAPRLVVCSGSLELDPSARLFTEPSDAERPIIFTHAASDPSKRERLKEVADIVIAGETTIDLGVALRTLDAQVVCCEGGPHLNGELIAAGLVDELRLSIAPLIAGGPTSGLIAGMPLAEPQNLTLATVVEDDGFLLLRYLRA
jgi:riboflavin-specific deaminase-like protein